MIREYVLERLEDASEPEAVRRWHAGFYTGMVEAVEPQLKGDAQAAWLNRQEGELNDKDGLAVALGNMGAVALDQHDARPEMYFKESLRLFQLLGERDGIAECLEGLAGVALMQSQGSEAAQRAARLCGAAEALREVVGAPLRLLERGRYEGIVAVARAQLGETSFKTAWAEGRAMPVEDVIGYALGGDNDDTLRS